MQQHMLINGTLCHSPALVALMQKSRDLIRAIHQKTTDLKDSTLPNKQNEVLSGYLHIKNIENFNISKIWSQAWRSILIQNPLSDLKWIHRRIWLEFLSYTWAVQWLGENTTYSISLAMYVSFWWNQRSWSTLSKASHDHWKTQLFIQWITPDLLLLSHPYIPRKLHYVLENCASVHR